jgi:hypothetical protein
VRQLLADKVSGNQAGIWLLIPEHLRLGSWELLCGWWAGSASTASSAELALRLALQPWCFGQRKLFQFIQRCGERPEACQFKAFVSTRDSEEVEQLSRDFPQRWHVEEFFKFNQGLGWQRAGTLNLHVRYAQMSLALLAQAVLHQLRCGLGAPYENWDAPHLANGLLEAMEGDVRVEKDTILVTYYNAPNVETLRKHYEELPAKLEAEHIDPRVPWLYGFKLDFRFISPSSPPRGSNNPLPENVCRWDTECAMRRGRAGKQRQARRAGDRFALRMRAFIEIEAGASSKATALASGRWRNSCPRWDTECAVRRGRAGKQRRARRAR